MVETSTTAIAAPDGSTGKTVSDSDGNTIRATALVSEKAVETAAQSGEAVTLPVEVKAANAATDAAPIEITVPVTEGTVQVEIPVTDATPGTVAVIVHPDGTEEVVKTSTTGEDCVTLSLEGSATVKIVDNSKEFVDVPDDSWYKETVDWASSREVMIGTGESRFAPDKQTNRAMMVQLLYNFEGASAPAEAIASFTDVHDDDWYADSVSWAVELGVAQGEGAAFGAMDNITREAAAVMLFNYAAAKGYDVEPHGDVGTFRDGGDASDWAMTALDWAVGNGIMNGKPGGLIDPQGYATRAEIATIMERFVSRLK